MTTPARAVRSCGESVPLTSKAAPAALTATEANSARRRRIGEQQGDTGEQGGDGKQDAEHEVRASPG